MANKMRSNRQKLNFRIEPSQTSLKPRNPVAVAARLRAAGPHQKTVSAQRQAHKRLIARKLLESEKD